MSKTIKTVFVGIIIFVMLCTGCAGKSSASQEEEYDWYINYLSLPDIWSNSFTGKGVTVAVIDSGIDFNLLGNGFDETRILTMYNYYAMAEYRGVELKLCWIPTWWDKWGVQLKQHDSSNGL